MSQKQLVEKTHHLQNQLEQLNSDLKYNIRNTIAIARFYKKKIQDYKDELQYQVQDGSPYRPILVADGSPYRSALATA